MHHRGTSFDTLARRSTRQTPKQQARRKTVLALWILAVAFVCVAVVLVVRLRGYQAAREEYAQARAAVAEETAEPTSQAQDEAQAVQMSDAPAFEPPAATAKPFYSTKVAALLKENKSTVAWLDIVGTEMQYPVVQGSDNIYYMTHTFKKKKNASGAIFVDSWNAPDFTDFNTVIYGHNMNDGSMFSGLREYGHQSFASKHPVIEVTLLHKKLRYRVFAAYVSQSEASADFRGQSCATELERSAFIKAARKRSTGLSSDQSVSRYDRLLTLVTCTGGTHPWYWVVHAVLVEEQVVAE